VYIYIQSTNDYDGSYWRGGYSLNRVERNERMSLMRIARSLETLLSEVV